MAFLSLSRIFFGESVRRMREEESVADLDIFCVGSLSDITRLAGAKMLD